MTTEKLDKEVADWNLATQKLAEKFVKRYFGPTMQAVDAFWVGGNIGGVLCVNDFWFDVNRIVEAMTLKPSEKVFFDYHNQEVDTLTKGKKMKVNFANFVKLSKK